MIFIKFPFPCDLKILDYGENPVSSNIVRENIESHLGYKKFSMLYNGKPVHDMDVIPADSTVQVIFSLCGGKGGFGSMLRAIGAQIEKTTNREACRDLSGRRLRDINEEQRLKKWIAKEAEREAEKIKRRQARIERLKSKAPHQFFDYQYEKEISELPDRINDALSEGLQKAKEHNKRPLEKQKVPKKSWLSDDFPVSSSDSELDETSATHVGSPPKKPKLASKDSSSCNSDVSESSQPQPCCSKDYFSAEESSMSSDSTTALIQKKYEENAISSDSMDYGQATGNEENKCDRDEDVIPVARITHSEENNTQESRPKVVESAVKDHGVTSEPDNNVPVKELDVKDDSPINLMDFQNVSKLEALGLDRLKSALMARGLKCGGSLSDRAQRLWTIRNLQPNEYPKKLLVKTKK